MSKFVNRATILGGSFFIAIIGILNEFTPFTELSIKKYISGFVPINLNSALEIHIENARHIYVSYPSLAFYLLLLIGAILMLTKRVTRLVVFCFAVILMQSIIGICFQTHFLLSKPVPDTMNLTVISVFFWFYRVLLIVFSFLVLKNHQNKATVRMEMYEEHGFERPEFIETIKPQRLLHNFVDYFIVFLTFMPLVGVLARKSSGFRESLNDISDVIGDKETLLLCVSILRILYYIFFESLFHATPAKYLTASRVIEDNGDRINFGSVFKRTLARLIPFEAFSFFGSTGWHDSLAFTTVVKEEEPTHDKTVTMIYQLLVPIILALLILTFFLLKYSESGKVPRFPIPN
ncbi:MAG: hypothetical protein RL757_920 [Bacteroidota bacterium]